MKTTTCKTRKRIVQSCLSDVWIWIIIKWWGRAPKLADDKRQQIFSKGTSVEEVFWEPKPATLLGVFVYQQPLAISRSLTWTQQASRLCFPYSMKPLAMKRLRKSEGRRGEGWVQRRGEGRTGLMWRADRLASASHRDVKCCGWLRRIASFSFFSAGRKFGTPSDSWSHPVSTFSNIYTHKKELMLYLYKVIQGPQTPPPYLQRLQVNFSKSGTQKYYKLCKAGFISIAWHWTAFTFREIQQRWMQAGHSAAGM